MICEHNTYEKVLYLATFELKCKLDKPLPKKNSGVCKDIVLTKENYIFCDVSNYRIHKLVCARSCCCKIGRLVKKLLGDV